MNSVEVHYHHINMLLPIINECYAARSWLSLALLPYIGGNTISSLAALPKQI